jgi:hypothetical protein
MPKIPPPDLPEKSFRLPDGRFVDDVMEEYWQKGLIDRETYETFQMLREQLQGLAAEALTEAWNRFYDELNLPPRDQPGRPPVAE